MPNFFVDSEKILQPLGLKVLRDSRYEILPGTRENSEEIPGKHGDIDFGTELMPGILELHCVTDDGLTHAQQKQKKRDIAKYLNPLLGYQKLVFADEPEVYYMVKYSGKLDMTPNSQWFDFVLPFKMSDPFGYSEEVSNELIAFNSGDNILIEVGGTVENPPTFIINNQGSPVVGFRIVIITPFEDQGGLRIV